MSSCSVELLVRVAYNVIITVTNLKIKTLVLKKERGKFIELLVVKKRQSRKGICIFPFC